MVVERRAFTSTGTSRSSSSSGAARCTGASQSSGAWNSPRFSGERGQWCEPAAYVMVPAAAEVSSSGIQQVSISGGTR